MASEFPRKGDFVIVTFDPQAGREQRGRRPALVVSHDLFNERTGHCIACPITTTLRPYPFHVPIPDGLAVSGVVMVDQVKSIDYRARGVKRIGPAPDAMMAQVLAVLDACIF